MHTQVAQNIASFHRRSLVWILSSLACIAAKELLPGWFWETTYYKGLFNVVRVIYDYALGWSPIPMIYIVVCIIIVRGAKWWGQWDMGYKYQWSRFLGGLAAVVTLFYVFWGFNYGQVSLGQRLELSYADVDQKDIMLEFQRATEVLKNEAAHLPEKYAEDDALKHLEVKDKTIRNDVEFALRKLELPHFGKVRVRQLWPNGLLLRLNTAGIYIPHAFEGHIDNGLLSVQKPFTIAHEMAHGYGVADEGACNFIAWLACSQSKDQWTRFGGAFTYWRYVAAEMPPDSVKTVLQNLPPVVQESIHLIKENDRKYPDFMPRARDAIYSTYLKKHGVSHGLRSYNEVVLLVQQYLEKQNSAMD